MARPDADPFRPPPEDCGHELWGRQCWCHPAIEQLCPVCLGDEILSAICARCGGRGMVPEFTADPDWPSVVVHKYVSIDKLN